MSTSSYTRCKAALVIVVCLSFYGMYHFGVIITISKPTRDLINTCQHEPVDIATATSTKEVKEPSEEQHELAGQYSHDTLKPDQRANNVKKACTGNTDDVNDENPNKILFYQPLNVAMCYVAKAGCTFWKRVFLALHKSSKTGKIEDALDIERSTIHGTKQALAGRKNLADENLQLFLFARDPYSRLFSCFITKFNRLDFWNYGTKIIQRLYGSNIKCGSSLTFTEFLVMATNKTWSSERRGMNEHWLPITTLCKPCLYNYKYIGKLESHEADRAYIASTLAFDSVAISNASKDSAVYDVISAHWATMPRKSCVNQTEYIHRIYDSYKIQGYVPLNSTITATTTMTKDEFTAIVYQQYKQRNMTSREVANQRRQLMIDAYKEVPLKMKEAIIERYKSDFKLFGYDMRPKDLFT